MKCQTNLTHGNAYGINAHINENHNEPYVGIAYKLFKNKKLKIFYNQSESMKTIGIMTPIFNIGKKHMNHNMDHKDHVSFSEKTICDDQSNC